MAEIKFKGPIKGTPKNEPKTPAIKFKGPVKKAEEDAPQADLLGGASDFIMKGMRNFNDALTFGLYDDLLQNTGLDPDAKAKLEEAQADPFANILGTTAGYMVPGAALESITAKAIPALAKNTVPAIIGRNALASGELSAVDQFAREGEVDPTRLAIDTAAGGVLSGALAGGSRLISPEARVRAMGNELTPAEKEAAKGFADYAGDQGIALNVPEAVGAINPTKAVGLNAELGNAARSPRGSSVVNAFKEGRKPGVAKAGQTFVSDILGGGNVGVSASAAKGAAADAFDAVKSGFRTTADPLYAAAEKRKVPPTHLKKIMEGGFAEQAFKNVADNKGLIKGLIAQNGGKMPAANSVLLLDAVKKELDAMVTGFQTSGRGNSAGFAADEAAALTNKMDEVAPTYAPAREISEQGRDVLSTLEDGPLGTISNASNIQTQSNALFSPTTGAGVETALEAARHLPDNVNLGLLANHVQNAAAKAPDNWANKALPTDAAASVADSVLQRAGLDEVAPKLTAARAVNNRMAEPQTHENGGPWGSAWSVITDYGKGRVAKKLVDPKTINKLGKMGNVQKMVNDILRGGTAASSEARRDEPLL